MASGGTILARKETFFRRTVPSNYRCCQAIPAAVDATADKTRIARIVFIFLRYLSQ